MELKKLKNELDEKADKKHQDYIKKYHAELKQYNYDPEALHTAWGMDWISKYKYKQLLQLLENEPERLLPEDCAVSYIENLLLSYEKDKCIANNDEQGYQELLRQEITTRYIDWNKNMDVHLKGLSLVYKKLQQINKKFEQKAVKRRKEIMLHEYNMLEQYEFDINQIHNAYGYELIDLNEHDRLIKLLEQSEKSEAMPEEEGEKYFAHILDNCKNEKRIVEKRDREKRMR